MLDHEYTANDKGMQHFEDRLQEASVEVPFESTLFAEIKKRVDAENRKRRFWVGFWTSTGLIVFLGSALWFNAQNSTNPSNTLNRKALPSGNLAEKAGENTAAFDENLLTARAESSASMEEKSFSNHADASSTGVGASETAKTAIESQQLELERQQALAETEAAELDFSRKNRRSEALKSAASSQSAKKDRADVLTPKQGYLKEQAAVIDGEKAEKARFDVKNSEFPQGLALENATAVSSNLEKAEATNSAAVMTTESAPAVVFSPLFALPNKGLSMLTNDMKADATINKQSTFPKTPPKSNGCFDFTEVGNVWAFEGYAGPAYGLRTLEAQSPDAQLWKSNRDKLEHSRFAWTVGGNAVLLTKNHLNLRLGAHFTQQNEVFEKNDPLFVRTVITTFSTPQGSQTDTVQEVGYLHIRTDNRLFILDIPVSVGYEFQKGRKGLGLYGGISTNVFFDRYGIIEDENGNILRLKKGDGFFKNNLGWSAQAGAQFFYTIQADTRVFVEPYIHIPLKSAVLESQSIGQRYRFMGLKIGLAKAIW